MIENFKINLPSESRKKNEFSDSVFGFVLFASINLSGELLTAKKVFLALREKFTVAGGTKILELSEVQFVRACTKLAIGCMRMACPIFA